MELEIIKCHGSANKFVMLDLVACDAPRPSDLGTFARKVCAYSEVEGADGVLYVVREGGYYTMRMFNPDGSEAEMCGNGIRCVARLVDQRYEQKECFTLRSGGALYPTRRAAALAEGVAAYGVDIAVSERSADFGFSAGEAHRAEPIASLGGKELFTALNLGNPHIVAAVDAEIDMERLSWLGEQVLQQAEDFPRGINVSLYRLMGENAIFVATYERGAGITYSCGTAMTASSTASVLLGLCSQGRDIDVYNRGGMVRCLCRIDEQGIVTRLTGNATYEWRARLRWSGEEIEEFEICENFHRERVSYEKFVEQLAL